MPAAKAVERSYAFARETTAEALAQAGLSGDFGGPLFLAAPPVEPEWSDRFALADRRRPAERRAMPMTASLPHARSGRSGRFTKPSLFGAIAERLADRFGTRGLPITLSTACASGATAIQLGVEAIRRGERDRALSIGADGSVTRRSADPLLAAVGAFDPERPAGKGLQALLARTATASSSPKVRRRWCWNRWKRRSRAAPTFSASCAAAARRPIDFHRTRSKPDGSPAIAAVRAALADAGLDEDEIGYINAHGTSTPENDKMEHLSLSTVFGERMRTIPVSSNKSMIGHTLTAAGAVEAVFSLHDHARPAPFRRPSTTTIPTRRSSSTSCRT